LAAAAAEKEAIDDMKREKSCGALVVRKNGENFDLVLLRHRFGGHWSFPKGHVEAGESERQTALREVREETGLAIEAPRLCGLKQFWEDDGTRYIVILYKTDRFSGELRSSREGKVFWIKRSELMNYQLPVSFPEMLRVFEDEGVGELYSHWEDGAYLRELL